MTAKPSRPGTSAGADPTPDLGLQLAAAVRHIAPLWGLHRFVAANPWIGLTDFGIWGAERILRAMYGVQLTRPTHAYVAELDAQGDADTELGIAAHMRGMDGDIQALGASLRAELAREGQTPPQPLHPAARLATVADALAAMCGRDWSRLVVDEFSAWAARHLGSEVQQVRSPWSDLPPYAAWQAEAAIDRGPELVGVPRFRQTVAQLPSEPVEAAAAMLEALAVQPGDRELYLLALAGSVHGWIGAARQRGWERELRGGADDTAEQLLVIRLAWDFALWSGGLADGETVRARVARGTVRSVVEAGEPRSEELRRLAHEAHEWGARRRLAQRMAPLTLHAGTEGSGRARPKAQLAFCIDVRSEAMRWALEHLDDAVETLGVAGFFGVPLGRVDEHGEVEARCPAIGAPAFETRSKPAPPHRQAFARAVARTARASSQGPLASFTHVEALGLGYLASLVAASLNWRPWRQPPSSLPRGSAGDVAAPPPDGPQQALARPARIEAAAGLLGALSAAGRLAPLVVLVGHRSTSRNNPHASGLQCGACGGHAGGFNAAFAAQLLNDPAVREGLQARGLGVPEDTHFTSAVHDTTTHDLLWPDRDEAPPSHRAPLEALVELGVRASARARTRRARQEGRPLRGLHVHDRKRASDWSQVRPEWGLAGCEAIIVGPRRFTRGRDLEGRAFLHEYCAAHDRDADGLAQIFGGPVVVSTWISLQYYASAVAPEVFGSGDKVLHNIVGTLGVLEGSGGDLRVGLPLQSVHDGTREVHVPRRLTAFVEAPGTQIDAALAQCSPLAALLQGGWLHMVATVGGHAQASWTRDGWRPWPEAGRHAREPRPRTGHERADGVQPGPWT